MTFHGGLRRECSEARAGRTLVRGCWPFITPTGLFAQVGAPRGSPGLGPTDR